MASYYFVFIFLSIHVVSVHGIDIEDVYENCHGSSQCFRFPGDCTQETGCEFIANWETSGNYTEFTVSAAIPQELDGNFYVSIGLNSLPKMDKSSTIDCIHYNGTIYHQLAYNEGYRHTLLNTELIEGLNKESPILDPTGSYGTFQGGFLTCGVRRLTTVPADDALSTHIFDLSVPNEYHILMAKGKASDERTINHHSSKTVSPTKFTFVNAEVSSSSPGSSSTPVFSTSPTSSPTSAASLLQEGCGTLKGCYVSPSNCKGEECDFIVTYRARGDYTDFEVYSGIEASLGEDVYLSIGFNDQQQMGGASVIDCIQYQGKQHVQLAYNEGKSSNALESVPGILEEYSLENRDGSLVCSFSRLSSVKDQNITSLEKYNLTTGNEYYLLAAKGKAKSNSSKSYHSSRIYSTEKIDFNAIRVSQGSPSMPPLVKAHGILMIISWMLLAGFGIINARYFKNEWPDQSKFGLKFWFLNHRTSMQILFVGCAVSFVLIFVHVGGWSKFDPSAPSILKAHPYIGVVAIFFVLLNPIMALFRPGILEDNRVIFNWAHRCVGQVSFLLAILNIFLGLYLPGIEDMLPSWVIYIMIAYAVFHLLTEVVLMIISKKESSKDALDLSGPANSQNALENASVNADRCLNQATLTQSIMNCNLKRWILRAYLIVTVTLVLILVVVFIWPPQRFEKCSGLETYFQHAKEESSTS